MPFAPTCVPVVLQLELLAGGQAVPGELDGLQLGAEDGLLRLDVDGGLLVAQAGRVVLAPALWFCNGEAAAVRPAKRGDPRGELGWVGGKGQAQCGQCTSLTGLVSTKLAREQLPAAT